MLSNRRSLDNSLSLRAVEQARIGKLFNADGVHDMLLHNVLPTTLQCPKENTTATRESHS